MSSWWEERAARSRLPEDEGRTPGEGEIGVETETGIGTETETETGTGTGTGTGAGVLNERLSVRRRIVVGAVMVGALAGVGATLVLGSIAARQTISTTGRVLHWLDGFADAFDGDPTTQAESTAESTDESTDESRSADIEVAAQRALAAAAAASAPVLEVAEAARYGTCAVANIEPRGAAGESPFHGVPALSILFVLRGGVWTPVRSTAVDPAHGGPATAPLATDALGNEHECLAWADAAGLGAAWPVGVPEHAAALSHAG